jgi:pimeloyl-ACP methyl ester carboxylesterase
MTTPEPRDPPAPDHRFIRTADGLRLHYLDYPGPKPARLPLVCLPGLARSADDFERVAARAQTEGRRVVALDYRGRGRSAWDPDWRNYSLDVEQADILAVLADAGVDAAVFLGTSRGGLHTMRLAAARPGLVRAAILNDIGPKIENDSLQRIKRYVGKLPPLRSMSDAMALMRLSAGQTFSGVDPEDWAVYARQTFEMKDGQVRLHYDPELAHTLDSVAPGVEHETYWDAFAALAPLPLLAIRGETTDLLSLDTLAEMQRRAPGMQVFTVPGQGHAPLLLDAPTIGRIADFLAHVG